MTFSSISYFDLKKLIQIEERIDDEAFDAWRDKGDSPGEEEEAVLRELIGRHRIHLDAYTEEEIKIKIIAPVMALMRYYDVGLTEWYERPLRGTIGTKEVNGVADFILARGDKEPEPPYFLLQEFKPEFSNSNPEVQLVAELLVSAELSGRETSRGAYTNGGLFRFVELSQADKVDSWVYIVSRPYHSMVTADLRDIFRYFHAVKAGLIA